MWLAGRGLHGWSRKRFAAAVRRSASVIPRPGARDLWKRMAASTGCGSSRAGPDRPPCWRAFGLGNGGGRRPDARSRDSEALAEYGERQLSRFIPPPILDGLMSGPGGTVWLTSQHYMRLISVPPWCGSRVRRRAEFPAAAAGHGRLAVGVESHASRRTESPRGQAHQTIGTDHQTDLRDPARPPGTVAGSRDARDVQDLADLIGRARDLCVPVAPARACAASGPSG